MNVLTLNVGSSSIKFALFSHEQKELFGEIEGIGLKSSSIWMKGSFSKQIEQTISSYSEAIEKLFDLLKSASKPFDAISHRVVFGGDLFIKPIVVEKKHLAQLKALIPFAPLHMPYELELIESCLNKFPSIKHIACFDSAFHSSIPPLAKQFALPPIEGVHRYGFHGLSYESIVSNLPATDSMIVAHLGSGSSLCAIQNGKSIDTTMGLTPLGGIPMETRPGDLDPGILLYLLKEKKFSIEKLEELLNHKSGLQAIAQKQVDIKTLCESKEALDCLAIDFFSYNIAKSIGALLITLGRMNRLVFTGGVGQNSPMIREKVCYYLSAIGGFISKEQNNQNALDIHTKSSAFSIHVLPADEEKMLAHHARSF